MIIFKSNQKKLEGDLKIKLCGKRLCPTESVKACACYFLSNFYFSPNDSPSKAMKNVFYFI